MSWKTLQIKTSLIMMKKQAPQEPRVHDIGIQCCCQPVTLRSVAVQTEDSKPKKNKANITPTPIQNEPYMYVPPCVDAVQWK